MLNVVWFKKDLRVHDHAALLAAHSSGDRLLCLFVYEPSLIQADDFSWRHFLFQKECLEELDDDLKHRGGHLVTAIGDVPRILEALRLKYGKIQLWSHEETGNALSYQRDLSVAVWAGETGTAWLETPQTGVKRRQRQRDGWAMRWAERMNAPVLDAPVSLSCVDEESLGILSPERFELMPDGVVEGDQLNNHRQKGGRTRGLDLIHSFLTQRGLNYTRAMSSPVTGYDACSRISPYLTYGVISMCEAHHIGMKRKAGLAVMKAEGQ